MKYFPSQIAQTQARLRFIMAKAETDSGETGEIEEEKTKTKTV